MSMIDRDGDAATNNDHEVTATIPEATEYEHIHFGVWAALGAAEDNGNQDVSNLGIGFIQNFSGSDLTGADMPNFGSATYNGNWAATVQEADEEGNGDITLTSGEATIEAEFEMGTIEATLDNLATLSGDISGNTFSGDEAEIDAASTLSLSATATFTGTFNGGFYGPKAAEAGGVFDFASEDNKDGAFRGAFGGAK